MAPIVAFGSAPAHADIFATVDYSNSLAGQSLKRVNATTGANLSLPSAANAPGHETHPSLSPDGRYLVFNRTREGTVRVLMVDRTTGRSADLFNGFEAASDPPTTATFSADGTKVLTGRRLERLASGSPSGALQASYTETDVTRFPEGPFPHRVVMTGAADSTSAGRTLQLTPFTSTRFAFGIEYEDGGPPARVAVQQSDGTATLSEPVEPLANPTISPSAGVVVYEKGRGPERKLVFRPLNGIADAPATPLPPLVNARNTSLHAPEFSADGRYLAFVRRPTTGNDGTGRLFVWDTQTQLLLKPDGVYGLTVQTLEGAIALEQRRVFRPNVDVISNLAEFSVIADTYVDMLVQQVVGTTTVLGRRAPRLRTVGRVRLGRFSLGRATRRARWSGLVGGRRLPRGDYLVTLRSVTRDGEVREHATPERLRIR